MFWYDFSFRSLTAAQDGRSVLEHAGIGAELLRAPQAISEQGCGYVVETADFEGARAFEQFLANGVRFRRVFRRVQRKLRRMRLRRGWRCRRSSINIWGCPGRTGCSSMRSCWGCIPFLSC